MTAASAESRCAVCGSTVGDYDRLCPACDAPLVPPERRVATILFADLSGYTALCQDLDPEVVQQLVHPLMRRLRRSAEDRGAMVPGIQGDGFMAIFGVPATHEDDAVRALATAADLQLIVSSLGATAVGGSPMQLELHVGIHSGEVLAAASRDGGGWSVTGDVVNVASRLCDASAPGEILVSSSAQGLSRVTFGWLESREMRLRGRRDLVAVRGWSWTDHSLEPGREVRWNAPLVNRHEPRATLDAHRDSPAGRCLAVVGEPGVGKTRLVLEWSAKQGEFLILRGRARAFGASSWWESVEDAMRGLAGQVGLARLVELSGLAAGEQPILERRWARLLGLMDTAETDSSTDLMAAFETFVALAARTRPVIVHFDDVHDAGSPLVEVAERCARLATAQPLLVILTARPEFCFGESVKVLQLQPLTQPDGERLIRELLPGLPEGAAARLHERVGGNPFYAEECTQLIRDEAYLYPERPGVPDASLERLLAEPTTMRAFVTARIDRLGEHERRLLSALAIATEHAPFELIVELAGSSDLGAAVSVLVDRGLLTAGRDGAIPRFRHGLTREIVQATMSARQRGALHDRAHGWYAGAGTTATVEGAANPLGLLAARAGHAVAAWQAAAQVIGPAGVECDKARRAVRELLDWCASLVALDPGAADEISRRASAVVDAAPDCIGEELKLELLQQRALCALELGDLRLARDLVQQASRSTSRFEESIRLRTHMVESRLLVGEGNSEVAAMKLRELAERSLRVGEMRLHLDALHALARMSESSASGVAAFKAVYEAGGAIGDLAAQSSSALMAATMSLMTDASEALVWLHRAEVGQQTFDIVGRAQSHVSRAWLALFEDRFHETLAQAESALALGRGGSAWQVEGFAALLAAEAALRLGDLDSARSHLASVEDRIRARGRAKGLLGLKTLETYIAALSGDAAGAGLLLSEAQQFEDPDAFESGTWDSVLGAVLLWRGDASTAAAMLSPTEADRRESGLGLAAVPIGLNRLRAIALYRADGVATALPEFLEYAGAAHATYALDLAGLIAAHAAAVAGGPVTDVDDPGFEGSECAALLAELRAIRRVRAGESPTAALQQALDAWTVLGYTAWRARCGFWLAEVTRDESHAAAARVVLERLKSPAGLEEFFREQWRTAIRGV